MKSQLITFMNPRRIKMKKFFKIVIIAGFIFQLLGCKFSKENTTPIKIKMLCFPKNTQGNEIFWTGYNSYGNEVMSQKLGTVPQNDDSVTATVDCDNSVMYFSIEIKDIQGECKFYTKIRSFYDYYEIDYWMYNYKNGYTDGNPLFAIHKDFVQDLQLFESLRLEFDDAPFYIYDCKDVSELYLACNYLENVTAYIAKDLETLIEQDYGKMAQVSISTKGNSVLTFDTKTSYLLIVPESNTKYLNNKTTSIHCSMEAVFNNQLKAQEINCCYYGNDGYIYYSNRDKNSLYRCDLLQNKKELVQETSNPVSAIEGNEFGIYFTAEKSIYKYDYSTKQPKLIYIASNPVNLIDFIDKKLLFINKSEMIILDSDTCEKVEAIKTSFDLPRAVKYIPEQKRIYYISGYSPNDIKYVEIDENYKIIGSGDSPYHGDYSFGNILYRFGNKDLFLLTRYGDVFSINDETERSKIKYSKTVSEDDFEFYACDDEYFYLLKGTYKDDYSTAPKSSLPSFFIEKRAFSEPLKTIAKTEVFNNAYPVTMALKDEKITVLWQKRNYSSKETLFEVKKTSFNLNLNEE